MMMRSIGSSTNDDNAREASETNLRPTFETRSDGNAALHEDQEGGILLDNSFISFMSGSSHEAEAEDDEDVKSDLSLGSCTIEDDLDETESIRSASVDGDRDGCSVVDVNNEGTNAQHEESSQSETESFLREGQSGKFSAAARSYLSNDTNETGPSDPQYVSPIRRLACQYHPHRNNTRTRSLRQTQTQQRVLTQRRQQQFTSQLMAADPNSSNNDGSNNNSINSSEPVVVLGVDISHLSGTYQFLVCAAGVFSFNLSFGFLQEFVAVEICNRNLGLFLAMMQFTGYTVLSYALRTFVNHNQSKVAAAAAAAAAVSKGAQNKPQIHSYPAVPTHMYLCLGVLSAIDMAMTNMAMHYINYPAKTLLKSSRVVFTMIFGVLMAGKRYRLVDYLVVLLMVVGLAIFMQADATSNAVFDPLGVVMLTISLLCDGATNIMSETIMKNYGVGQDELIFRMYSLALIAVTATASFNGDLRLGIIWMTKPGTYDEWKDGVSEDEITWNALGKVTMIVLFSSMGFFGSSCSAAITKNFGALTMSMTSTARRATTLFISFFLFDNECTFEHVTGVVVFITALTTKSFMSRSKGTKAKLILSPPPKPRKDLEMGRSKISMQDGSAASMASGDMGHRKHSGNRLS